MSKDRLFITLEGVDGPDCSINILGKPRTLLEYWDVAFDSGTGPVVKRFTCHGGGTVDFKTTGHSYFLKMAIEGHEFGQMSPSQFAVGDKLVGQLSDGLIVTLGTIKKIQPLPEEHTV